MAIYKDAEFLFSFKQDVEDNNFLMQPIYLCTKIWINLIYWLACEVPPVQSPSVKEFLPFHFIYQSKVVSFRVWQKCIQLENLWTYHAKEKLLWQSFVTPISEVNVHQLPKRTLFRQISELQLTCSCSSVNFSSNCCQWQKFEDIQTSLTGSYPRVQLYQMTRAGIDCPLQL